jgi:hypothetical protein
MATPSVPGTPVSVAVKDLNGDGKPDIAVSSAAIEGSIRQTYITVLINNGASGFNPGTSYPTVEAGVLGIGDFNSDNHPAVPASRVNCTLIGFSLCPLRETVKMEPPRKPT